MMKFHFSREDWSKEEWALALDSQLALSRNANAGFLQAAFSDLTWSSVKTQAQAIQGKADLFVVVGIGGSSLGAKALISLANGKMPLFLDNLDPESVQATLGQIKNLQRTHWLWISKSGTTLETLVHLQQVDHLYRASKLNLKDHSTVIADPEQDGPLQIWAREQQVPFLSIPANVSGRFSVFTAAGLLPATLAGVDFQGLREGLREAREAQELASQLIAATLSSWRRGEWVTMFWTYGDRFRPYTAWLQQLWAESLAKLKTRSGAAAPRVSFPISCVGSLDQHSILQQVMEGARDKWVWLLRLESLQTVGTPLQTALWPEMKMVEGKTLGQIFSAEAEGMARALNEVGISTCEWLWPKSDARAAGFALLLMEIVVASLGECLDLNAFNQPGVERGKTITQALLRKSLS